MPDNDKMTNGEIRATIQMARAGAKAGVSAETAANAFQRLSRALAGFGAELVNSVRPRDEAEVGGTIPESESRFSGTDQEVTSSYRRGGQDRDIIADHGLMSMTTAIPSSEPVAFPSARARSDSSELDLNRNLDQEMQWINAISSWTGWKYRPLEELVNAICERLVLPRRVAYVGIYMACSQVRDAQSVGDMKLAALLLNDCYWEMLFLDKSAKFYEVEPLVIRSKSKVRRVRVGEKEKPKVRFNPVEVLSLPVAEPWESSLEIYIFAASDSRIFLNQRGRICMTEDNV